MSSQQIKLTWRLSFAIASGVIAVITGAYSLGFVNTPATAQEVILVKNSTMKNRTLVNGALSELSILKTDLAVEKQARRGIDQRLGKIEETQSEMRLDQKAIKNDISQILRLMISQQPRRGMGR